MTMPLNWLAVWSGMLAAWLAVSTCTRSLAAEGPGTQWTAAELARGYVVCSDSYLRPFIRGHVPTRATIVDSVSCSLARREYEPIQIGVHALAGNETGLNKVRMEVDIDLPYTIHRFLPVDATVKGRDVAMPYGLLPEDTIPSISPGKTDTFWLTLRAPRDARAGLHRGRIRIVPAGREPTVLALKATVRPFELPDADIAFGMYYHIGYLPEQFRTDEYQRKCFEDMAAHGLTSCTVWPAIGTPAGGASDQDAASRGDPGKMEHWAANKLLKMMNEAGLLRQGVPAILYSSLVLDKEEAASSRIPLGLNNLAWARVLRQHLQENGWPELLLYGRDEPGPKHAEQLMKMLGPWKKVPDIRIVTAMSITAAYCLGFLHDVWIMHIGQVTPEVIKEAKRLGAEVWTYSYDLRGTNPLAHRYYSGLYTWSFGLRGNFLWAYAYGQFFLTEAGAYSQTPYFGCIVPSADGPLPTVGWEGRREGIDDYRYLALLYNSIARVPADDPIAAAARAWLDELRGKVGWDFYRQVEVGNRSSVDWLDPNPTISVADYDRMRQIASDYIIRLSPLAKGKAPTAYRSYSPKVDVAGGFRDKSVQDCIAGLADSDASIRRAAAAALAERGPEGAEAVPALARLVSDPEVRMVAFRALEAMGPAAEPAVPALEAVLDQEKAPFVRLGAGFALSNIGPGAVMALTKTFDDLDETYWCCDPMVLIRIAEMGPAAAQAAPAMLPLLQAEKHFTRDFAAQALGRIAEQSNAAAAVPELVKALARARGTLRVHIHFALFRFGHEPEAQLNDLVALLKEDSWPTRWQVAEHLTELGPQAAAVLPALKAARQAEKHGRVRSALDAAIKSVGRQFRVPSNDN